MRNYYYDFKNLHDSIKPIRGRSEEVRPIGQRRRTWETIEMDGDVVACRLYNTQVVRYYPDGRIGVQCQAWSTPLTAEFIHTHSPWQCYKRYNKLWVLVPSESEKYKYYPIPDKGELQLRIEGNHWVPVGDVVVEKRVVNRAKAKEAREPYRPFLDWARTFMRMSDGWIMHATRKEALSLNPHGEFGVTLYEDTLLDMMRDETRYLEALCSLLYRNADAVAIKLAETMPVEWEWSGGKRTFIKEHHDMRFKFELLSGRVRRMIDKQSDIYDKVQVELGSNAQTNIV
jgi:hypothetical protein